MPSKQTRIIGFQKLTTEYVPPVRFKFNINTNQKKTKQTRINFVKTTKAQEESKK